MLDITRLAQADQCDLKKLGELRTWLNEQRNMLASYQRRWGIGTSGIGWAAASAAGAAWAARSSGGACLGSVITPTLAAAFGGFVGVPFGNLGEKVGVNLGSLHHSMAKPEHHRLIVGLDSLPAKSQSLS